MSDHLNKKVLLIGAGPMAFDHFKVLKALGCKVTVIGRSVSSAMSFEEKSGEKVVNGGLENFLKENKEKFDAAIVVVGMEQLAVSTKQLIEKGFKNILVEKPAGLDLKEIKTLAVAAAKKRSKVFVAYNRRFYASVRKAMEIIKQDGGLMSFNFEFTEWSHTIEPLKKAKGVKENWLLANSTHVIDLAFFFGGKPTKMNCYAEGKLSWHKKAVFSGSGKTKNNILFSYQANWNAPGRWGLELLTKESRLILRPLEGLQIQKKGSVAISQIELSDTNDISFKPGLYLQNLLFLSGQHKLLIPIKEQAEMAKVYSRIASGKNQ